MKWLIYNYLFAVGYGLMMPKFLYRMWKRGGYKRGFMQRLAKYDDALLARLKEKRRVWVHAVSVGEIGVALMFMEELRKLVGCSFVLSTTTSTGYKVAEQAVKGDDLLIYYPTDFPSVVRKALDVINPLAIVLTEAEIWPNMIRIASGRGIPVALINGRISESSYSGYSMIKGFMSEVLEQIRLMLMQTNADRDRLVTLGAAHDRVEVVGNSKYDISFADLAGESKGRAIMDAVGFGAGDPVILGGSTWPGEEAVLLDIFKRLRGEVKDLRLVLVPRHAERRNEVVAEIRAAGLGCLKRTEMKADGWKREGGAPDVLLADTTGELRSLYTCATVIFVGKSLTQHGGQNVIEPAMLGKPVVVGPNMENFEVVMDDFLEAGAILQVKDAAALQSAISGLLTDAARRSSLGERASRLVAAHRGATAKSARQIAETIDGRPVRV